MHEAQARWFNHRNQQKTTAKQWQAMSAAGYELRDRAYAHLKIAMDEVSACGQHVFWRDEARRRGYCSEYLRKAASRHAAKKKTHPEQEAPNGNGSAQNR